MENRNATTLIQALQWLKGNTREAEGNVERNHWMSIRSTGDPIQLPQIL